jgi:hypothetical protein
LRAGHGRIKEDQSTIVAETPMTPPRRKPLPDHLPHEDVLLDVVDKVCGCCGGTLHAIGESVSEMLDWVPAQLRVGDLQIAASVTNSRAAHWSVGQSIEAR